MAIIEELFNYKDTLAVLTAITACGIFLKTIFIEYTYPGIPIFGLDGTGPKAAARAKHRYTYETSSLMFEGVKKFRTPFQVLSSLGPKIIIPPDMVNEIKNIPDLEFGEHVRHDYFGDYPGFDGFSAHSGSTILVDMIRVRLTQALGRVTDGLAKESIQAITDIFPVPSPEWTPITVYSVVVTLVSRLSSWLFLGPDVIVRHPEWLEISISYTISIFHSASILKRWPRVLQPIIHWVLPETRALRKQVAKARAIIEPEVANHPPGRQDAIAWFTAERAAQGKKFDITAGQLGLTAAAIHTSAGLLTNAIYDICAYPQYTEILREEVINVLKEDGMQWKKTGLYKMRKMDSFLKEVLRLNPISVGLMNRRARARVELSDGTVIPKGATIVVPISAMSDPDRWGPTAHEFDGLRFYNLRQLPENEHQHQLVQTDVNHMGFGHGTHSCPGRFFAVNEIKIALAMLLVRYEMRFKEGQTRPLTKEVFADLFVDMTASIEVRARKMEPEFAGVFCL